jgi:voltage-gated potassium channel
MRRRIYEILEVAREGDRVSHLFDVGLMILIVLNVVAILAESTVDLHRGNEHLFRDFEVFSVAVFSFEYVLRIWSCTSDPRFSHPVRGRLAYLAQPMLVVDLLAILPFYVAFLHVDLRVLRALRLLRILRLMKLARYSHALQVFGRVLRAKSPELLSTILLMLLMLVVASSLMFSVENEAQPQVFSSIPVTMWWGVATLTTVGYGDMAPVTGLGRLLGSVIAVLGIGMFALPAGILGAAFTEEMRRATEARQCPHCGGPLR